MRMNHRYKSAGNVLCLLMLAAAAVSLAVYQMKRNAGKAGAAK